MDDVTIRFRYGPARFTLIYPAAIENMPQDKLKKLFKLMVCDWNHEVNADAVRLTYQYLNAYVEETKSAWAEASRAYQNGFVDTTYRYCSDKRAAAANNMKLLNAVKHAKAGHERAQKLLAAFAEVESKYFRR